MLSVNCVKDTDYYHTKNNHKKHTHPFQLSKISITFTETFNLIISWTLMVMKAQRGLSTQL